MNLDVFGVIALTLHANNNDGITSKTAIQKLVYFHTLKIQKLNDLDYDPYFYGPSSYKVSEALDEMTAFFYVHERAISRYYETYSYKLIESGLEYAEKTLEKYSDEYDVISDTVKTCIDHCDLQHNPLSYAAKAYYILKYTKDPQGNQYSAKDVKDVATRFDWDASDDDASTGIKLLQKLDLVS